MHPYLPLPISLDTSIMAGPGLFEWHVIVAPDLSTLAMVLPAGSNAEFQMGDDDSEDAEYDDGAGEGISEDARGQGLPATGNPLGEYESEEPEEDGTEFRRLGSVMSHVRLSHTYRR